MTDRDRDSYTPPPQKKHTLTPEQVAALSPEEKAELIAELEAAIEVLRAPVPQPYPKWVEIGGVPMIVQSPEEEAAKIAADAGYQKEQKRAAAADQKADPKADPKAEHKEARAR